MAAGGGGILHFLVLIDTPAAAVSDAQRALRETTKDPEVTLRGPIVFSEGRYALVSSVLLKPDAPPERAFFASGRAPVIARNRLHFSFDLTPDQALLLRPSILDDLGLIPAVRWLAREVARTSDLHVEVSTAGVQDNLLEEYRTCIYRVVQEALRNCGRHAAATTAQVRIEQREGTLHLTVSDDGTGFEPSEERGLGVLGMEERVTHLGGSFKMRSTPGAGTVVDVLLPIRSAPVMA